MLGFFEICEILKCYEIAEIGLGKKVQLKLTQQEVVFRSFKRVLSDR